MSVNKKADANVQLTLFFQTADTAVIFFATEITHHWQTVCCFQ